MRLLVVEDDRDLNRQLVKAFEQAGYAVDEAFDGEEGEFLGETEPYDAVVLDIGLPGKDGVAVLEAWRKAGRKMPVLVLIASSPIRPTVTPMSALFDQWALSLMSPKPIWSGSRPRALLSGCATTMIMTSNRLAKTFSFRIDRPTYSVPVSSRVRLWSISFQGSIMHTLMP